VEKAAFGVISTLRFGYRDAYQLDSIDV